MFYRQWFSLCAVTAGVILASCTNKMAVETSNLSRGTSTGTSTSTSTSTDTGGGSRVGCQIPGALTGGYESFVLAEVEAKIQRYWDAEKAKHITRLKNNFDNGNPYILYNANGYMRHLLELVSLCQDSPSATIDYRKIRSEIANIMNGAAAYLESRDYVSARGGIFKATEWQCNDLPEGGNAALACTQLPAFKDKEYVGASVEGLFLMAKLLAMLARVPPADQTAAEKLYLSQYTNVILNHVIKWIAHSRETFNIYSPDRTHHCDKAGYWTLQEIVDIKQSHVLTQGESKFCNILVDREAETIGIVAEILGANAAAPGVIAISQLNLGILRAFALSGSNLIKKKLIAHQINGFENGQRHATYNLDPGSYVDHPEYEHAGNEDTSVYPPKVIHGGPMMSWDLSHIWRIQFVLRSLLLNKSTYGSAFPSRGDLDRFSHQFVATFNRNCALPKFTNFFDGTTNGWYRVGYSGQYGYEPYQMSSGALMSIGFLTPFAPPLALIQNTLWKLTEATSQAQMDLRKKYYSTAPWKQPEPEDYTTNNITMLKFYAGLIGVNRDVGTNVHCR